MSDAKENARDVVQRLLLRRLERGGFPTRRPEIWFACEPQEPVPYPDGMEVRVCTWRHWSTALVDFDAASGDMMRVSIDRYGDPATDAVLTQDEVEEVARRYPGLPADAVWQGMGGYEHAPGTRLVEARWKRVHKGMLVDGDYLLLRIHPETKRVVEFQRKWRPL